MANFSLVNTGTQANDRSGDTLRQAFIKINDSLTYLNDGKVNSSLLGQANGVATLGADGKIPNGQLPDLAINEVYTVSSEVAQLALDTQQGDIVIRTDLGNVAYINNGGTSGTISDFTQLAISAAGNMGTATYDPAGIAQQVVGITATQTLTNKTLTNPTINSATLNGNLTGTAILNDTALGGGSPSEVRVPTQSSVKSYVDANLARFSNVISGTMTEHDELIWNSSTAKFVQLAPRYINATHPKYGLSTSKSGTDNALALEAAMLDAITRGLPLYVPSGTYKMSKADLAGSAFNSGKTLTIIGDDNTWFEHPNNVQCLNFFLTSRIGGPYTFLTTRVVEDETVINGTTLGILSQNNKVTEITFPAGVTQNFARGDILWIGDNGISQVNITGASLSDQRYSYRGELAAIIGIVGDKVYLHHETRFDFSTATTADKRVYKMDKDLRIRLVNIGIRYDSAFGSPESTSITSRQPSITIVGCTFPVIENCRFDYLWRGAVQVKMSWCGVMRGCHFRNMLNHIGTYGFRNPRSGSTGTALNGLGYGMDLYGPNFCFMMIDNIVENARHAFTTNTAKEVVGDYAIGSYYNYGEPHYTLVANNMFLNAHGCPLDTHEGSYRTGFVNNHVVLPNEPYHGSVSPKAAQLRGVDDYINGLYVHGGVMGVEIDYSVDHRVLDTAGNVISDEDNTTIIRNVYFEDQYRPQGVDGLFNVVGPSGFTHTNKRTLHFDNIIGHFPKGLSKILTARNNAATTIRISSSHIAATLLNNNEPVFDLRTGNNSVEFFGARFDFRNTASSGLGAKRFAEITGLVNILADDLTILGSDKMAYTDSWPSLFYVNDGTGAGTPITQKNFLRGLIRWDSATVELIGGASNVSTGIDHRSSFTIENMVTGGQTRTITDAMLSGGTYTISRSDFGMMLKFKTTIATLVQLPATLRRDFNFAWSQLGAGQLTFSAASGATVLSYENKLKSSGQGAVGGCYVDQNTSGTAAAWVVGGNLSA